MTTPRARQGMVLRPKGFADDQAGQSDGDHAGAHVDVAGFVVLSMRQPAKAVMALDRHRPMVIISAGLMEEDLTMSGLLPVARMDRPSRVFKNSSSRTTITATKSSATSSLRIS